MKKRKDYVSDLIYSMKKSGIDLYEYIFIFLTEKQSLIFKMRFDEEGNIKMSRKDIARELGVSNQAIDSSLNSIYKKINDLSKHFKINVDFDKKIEKPIVEKEPTTISRHADELIQTIRKLKRLPKSKQSNNMISEVVFSDNGTDQRSFYNHLISEVAIIKRKVLNNEKLSFKEKQKLFDYNAIIEELKIHKNKIPVITNSYIVKNLNSKVPIFIDIVNCELIHNSSLTIVDCCLDKYFSDGISFTDFYKTLKEKAQDTMDNLNNKKYVTEQRILELSFYKMIENFFSFYPSRDIDNMFLIYSLLSSLNIDFEKNKSICTKSYAEVYSKIRFLLENNIPLEDSDGYINSIMFMSEPNIKAEYNISLEELTKKYIDGKVKSEDSLDVVKRLCR